jgi:hypothetical protein
MKKIKSIFPCDDDTFRKLCTIRQIVGSSSRTVDDVDDNDVRFNLVIPKKTMMMMMF